MPDQGKGDRRRLTLYLDYRHQEWFDSQPNCSRSDLFNEMVDYFRLHKEGLSERELQQSFNQPKINKLTERCLIRFSAQQVYCINRVSTILKMRPIDFIREVVWRYTLQMIQKHEITIPTNSELEKTHGKKTK